MGLGYLEATPVIQKTVNTAYWYSVFRLLSVSIHIVTELVEHSLTKGQVTGGIRTD